MPRYPSLDSAIDAIDSHGALLAFPLKGKTEPLSLWKVFYPRTPMRWDWSETADGRVPHLWHLREELSRSGSVAYSKWFQNRGTFFSLRTFECLLSVSAAHNRDLLSISQDSANILRILEEDSPLGTKELKRALLDSTVSTDRSLDTLLRPLWRFLQIVGFGEKDEGGFPSLMIGATNLLFEDVWEEAKKRDPEKSLQELQSQLGEQNPFFKYACKVFKIAPH